MPFLFTDQYEGCPKETTVTSGNAHTQIVRDYLSGMSFTQTGGLAYVDDSTSIMPSPRHLILSRNAVSSAFISAMCATGGASLPAVTYWGFHFSIDSFAPSAQQALTGIGTPPVDYQFGANDILVTNTGAVRFGSAGTASASGLITPNTLYHMQVKYTKATKQAEIYLDGTLILTATSSGIAAEPGPVVFFRASTGAVSSSHAYLNRFDNIWIHDTALQGAASAVRVPLLASVGTPAFVPQGGAASNLAAVNKTSLSQTTYNESTAANNVGDRFSLDTSGLPGGSGILALSLKVVNRKAASGTRLLSSVMSDGTTDVKDALPESIGNFSSKANRIYATAADGTAWDLTKLTATNVGYEVTA